MSRRHRFDRLRLPDVVPGEVHRALPAGAHAPREPELPGGLDGQAPRRLRAEHRLHAGAARRAAAADGHGRPGLRRLPAWLEAAGIDTSLVKVVDGKFTASFFCSTDEAQQPDRVVLHGRHGQRRRAVVPDRPGLGCEDLAIISPNDPGAMVQYAEECQHARHPVHLGSGPAVRADDGDELKDGIVGAFMVICNDYEFELIRQKTGIASRRC
jgi:hypothetical protein